MKILNLYAGLGGNRLGFEKFYTERGIDIEVTAVEQNADVAAYYQKRFPQDEIFLCNVKDFIEKKENLKKILSSDLIWGSPPCQSHSRVVLPNKNRFLKMPNMHLYRLIILLMQLDMPWIVENVYPFYHKHISELFLPQTFVERHAFWTNQEIQKRKYSIGKGIIIENAKVSELEAYHDIYLGKLTNKRQYLRNCINWRTTMKVLEMLQQKKIGDFY